MRKRFDRRDSNSAISDDLTSLDAQTVRVTFSKATDPAGEVEDALGTTREISYRWGGSLFTISLCSAGTVATSGGCYCTPDIRRPRRRMTRGVAVAEN